MNVRARQVNIQSQSSLYLQAKTGCFRHIKEGTNNSSLEIESTSWRMMKMNCSERIWILNRQRRVGQHSRVKNNNNKTTGKAKGRERLRETRHIYSGWKARTERVASHSGKEELTRLGNALRIGKELESNSTKRRWTLYNQFKTTWTRQYSLRMVTSTGTTSFKLRLLFIA